MKRTWMLAAALLAACDADPPAPVTPAPVNAAVTPPPLVLPVLEPPREVAPVPPVGAPDPLATKTPEQLVLDFSALLDELLVAWSPDRPSVFLIKSAEAAYGLRARLLTPEVATQARDRVENGAKMLQKHLAGLQRPRYAVLTNEPAGPDACTVVIERDISKSVRVEHRAVDLVRREGRWWIAVVRQGGKGTLPLELPPLGKLTTVPPGHVWVESLESTETAAQAYGEHMVRNRVEQSRLYVGGMRGFIAQMKRFCTPEMASEAEGRLAAAEQEGLGHARAMVHTVGKVVFVDPTHVYFPLAVPLDEKRSTVERIDLTKMGAEWRVSRIGLPHDDCKMTGVCRFCEGSGKNRDAKPCPFCQGSGKCRSRGCDGTGFLPSPP